MERPIYKVIILLIVILSSFCSHAQMKHGQYSIGYSGGYGFVTEQGILRTDFRYNLIDYIRIEPTVSHFLKKNGLKTWNIGLNVHYVLSIKEVAAIYPLVGVTSSFWNLDRNKTIVDEVTGEKTTERQKSKDTYLGGMFGLGLEVYILDEIILGTEVKYNALEKRDQLLVGVRVAYNFIY